MAVQLLPANQVDFNDYLHAFNEAYSDYFVPLHMQRDPMLRLIKRDAIDMDASRVAVLDGQVIGMGMLAVQNGSGWIGGLGVIPSHRGQGIGRLLTSALLDEARRYQLKEVRLEVIEQNIRAYKLYESLGFQKTRRLLIVNRRPFITNLTDYDDLRVEDMFPEDALPHYADFQRPANPWQRRYEALDALKDDMDAWLVYRGNDLMGYAMGWVVSDTIRLMDIASHDDRATQALLEYIQNLAPMNDVGISNLDENDPVWKVMGPMGYEISLSQFEMQMTF